jgi:hypothetical protein
MCSDRVVLHAHIPPCSEIVVDIDALRRILASHFPELMLQEDPKNPDSANVKGDAAELFSGLMNRCEEAQVSQLTFSAEHVTALRTLTTKALEYLIHHLAHHPMITSCTVGMLLRSWTAVCGHHRTA